MIKIICIGKTKTDFILEGMEEYIKRISKYNKITLNILPDAKLTNSININIVKEKEAKFILSALKEKNNYKILLDKKGKQYNSKEFAYLINEKNFHITFIIGGVYGVSKKVEESVNEIISFSKMTFTHQMIRLILLEQIYRAITIIKGKKYHY